MHNLSFLFVQTIAPLGFVLIFVFFIGIILLAVFYLINLQNTLLEVSEKNRKIPAGNVWLMLIPLFNLIYPFILYPKISDSLKDEYNERGLPSKGDYARGIGITMPILGLCGFIPGINIFAGLAQFILFIIYWSKMSNFKNELKSSSNS